MRPILNAIIAVFGVVNLVVRWAVMPRERFYRWVDRMESE
jgi:hypothetical protein